MEITSVEGFLSYFQRIRDRTNRVIACIPPDKIDWTHRDGTFTLGDLIRHIGATERYMFAENARRRPSRYPGCGTELADGYDECVAFLERMHAESTAIFAALTDVELRAKCETPNGTAITTWKWLRAMLEHEIHHRGQIYLYLSMLGVETPPLYGLTSEQVQERSHP